VPADARLWVDNVECPLTSSERSFDTPKLNVNQQYAYTMKAVVVRNGQTFTETQQVVITPGQAARVDLNNALAQRFASVR
jgi:uncharacterized protein (TIGR03000 family)